MNKLKLLIHKISCDRDLSIIVCLLLISIGIVGNLLTTILTNEITQIKCKKQLEVVVKKLENLEKKLENKDSNGFYRKTRTEIGGQ